MSERPDAGSMPSRHQAAGHGWLRLHLFIAWLTVWGLYTTLIVTAHDGPVLHAAFAGARAISAAALLGLLVQRLTQRLPWPRPLRPVFLVVHLLAAVAYAVSWVGLTSALDSLVRGQMVLLAPAGIVPFVILGIWLYAMVAGISYAVQATERAARAEAAAVTTQLAALRAQLNPHFLFNALHTVVQLIPLEPGRAAIAAEQVASLLRTVIEEDRDLVPLAAERAFVERYLAVEHIRFGDRLTVRFDVVPSIAQALIPSFALQTLVENAVRHGAAPRVECTNIDVAGRIDGDRLHLTVTDSGVGAGTPLTRGAPGTGLRRLAERLDALYGANATLAFATPSGGGFAASITLPLDLGDGD